MKRRILLVVVWVGLCLPMCARAEGVWRTQADVSVTKAGLVEVVLPLAMQADDLRVVGPEGQTRSTEVYWRDDVRPSEVNVEVRSVRLLSDGNILWEGKLESSLQTERIFVRVADAHFMGKVAVQGFTQGRWVILAKDAALYQGEGGMRAEIPIPKGLYGSFRLAFEAFNRMNKKKLVPVDQVTALGHPVGKDYAKETVTLKPQVSKEGDEMVVSASLPGKALWVEKTDLTTQGQFSGEASLGCEEVVDGTRKFVPLQSGVTRSSGKDSNELKVEVGGALPSRILVWRVKSDHYFGPIRSWTVTVRCPRLRFRADPVGTYRVQNGTGEGNRVVESPSSDGKVRPMELHLGPIRSNGSWRPESLAERSPLAGGPFDGTGYSWQAAVGVAGPGYYRLVLDLATSLGEDQEGLRIVREGKQVPYFWGTEETVRIAAPFHEEYDPAKNMTVWTFTLPVTSGRWGDLVLESEGVFKRSVVLERKDPGTRGWETWHRWDWENKTNGKSESRVSLRGLDDQEARVVVGHEDNRPIPLQKATVEYRAPSLCFLVDRAGDYVLYGGNPRARASRYDLELVQNELMDREPQTATMGERKEFAGRGFKSRLFGKFQDTNLWLYAVLGLVTIVLLLIIARLFPKTEEKG